MPKTIESSVHAAVKMPLPGPEARKIVELDHQFVSPSYTRPYPLVVRSALGAMVEDVDGNRFLDMNAGIAVTAAGHCHPRVVEAIQRQASELIHMSGSDFYYEGLPTLARKLAESAPSHKERGDEEKKVFFCNSGAEAVEGAIKLARHYTGRDKLIAFHGAFHGRTLGALSLTASKPVQREGFSPLLPGVFHLPYPNLYRRPDGVSPEDWGVTCARAIETELFHSLAPRDEVAAIVVEPVQGEGGYLVPPATFLPELRRIADENGIMLVFDEVQSGVGRTGKMWACEHFGVAPDILTAAKGIASGMPLGALIAPGRIMSWPPGSHASTFGGNPVSIAAALATIELLEGGLIANAARVGGGMIERLATWPGKYPQVGSVRGLGLMIGIELVNDPATNNPATKEPAAELRDCVVKRVFEKGVLILGCGESTVRLSPPLIITAEQAEFALDVIEECLDLDESDVRVRIQQGRGGADPVGGDLGKLAHRSV